jgi:2-iminobutanoate/2-iminopropanoate deaminase
MTVTKLPGSSEIPYSAAVIADNVIYTAGQIGQDSSGQILDGIEAQARTALANLKSVVEEAGGTLETVTKVLIFLVNRGDFEVMNQVYRETFSDPFPARSTIITELASEELLIEIEAIAHVAGPR